MTTGSHDQAGSTPDSATPTTAESTAEPSPVEKLQGQVLQAQVIEAIRTCYDPEIPVNVYDLGLIYDVQIDPAGQVDIKMTDVDGVGPKTAVALQEAGFKSVGDLAGASAEAIAKTKGIGKKTAEKIYTSAQKALEKATNKARTDVFDAAVKKASMEEAAKKAKEKEKDKEQKS